MRFYFTAVLLLFAIVSVAQSRINQGPEPKWVRSYEYNTKFDSSGTSGGYIYLLVSQQHNVESRENYMKVAMKVLSDNGLGSVSSINEFFDPSFQKITFHTLNIIRGEKVIDKLDVRKFELIRREEEMSRAIYDKSLSAVYNVPDVRVGDILEYSFTTKGFNPAFEDHAFGTFFAQYGTPVTRFGQRLVTSSSRPLTFKSHQGASNFTEKKNNNVVEYERVIENVPALLTDDMLPDWFVPYPRTQYSDFQSWQEVKQWARKLYSFKEPADNELKQLVKTIQQLGTPEEKIRECIRIVQADVRYLSFSDGIHGYKPHAPSLVLAQKYGDCKDKSYLLAFLLNQNGIESYPALVSTEIGPVLHEKLPNPWAFNHCIVQFIHNDSAYWIDPTLRPQVGRLKEYFIPLYEKALVINDKPGGLDEIPFGYKKSKIDVVETYTMDEVGGFANLKVRTEYYGDEADEIRNYSKTTSKEEIHKNYLNFYSKDYADVSLKSDVVFDDDKERNVVTSEERYLIKDFWKRSEGKETAALYARVLASYLKIPDNERRTMPIRIAHPCEVHHTIKVSLPNEWTADDFSNTIDSKGFTFRSSGLYNDQTMTLRYTYKSKAGAVSGDDVQEYIRKMNEARDSVYYTITFGDETESNNSAKYIFLVVVMGVVGLLAYRKMSR
jgi:transglutaminase-like putative cysteine protease